MPGKEGCWPPPGAHRPSDAPVDRQDATLPPGDLAPPQARPLLPLPRRAEAAGPRRGLPHARPRLRPRGLARRGAAGGAGRGRERLPGSEEGPAARCGGAGGGCAGGSVLTAEEAAQEAGGGAAAVRHRPLRQ